MTLETSDIQKKSTDELERLAGELRESMRSIRFGSAGSRARDVKEGKAIRRDVARIETELTARAIAERGEWS